MTVQDEATADEYLQILAQLNVDVIRAEDVDAYRANKDKQGDSRLHGIRVQEMFDDPIRMYLHQMGQVPLLSREQEVDICVQIEEAEAKTKDMFNRFAFAPAMYMSLLDRLENMEERFDRIVTDKYDDNRDAYMAQLPEFRRMLRRARGAAARSRCLEALCFTQKAFESICDDIDERLYLPCRSLAKRQADALKRRPSKRRARELEKLSAEMAEYEEVDDVKEWVLDTLASWHEVNECGEGLQFEPEYFEIVDAITLQPIADWDEAGELGAVGCIAVWLDGVRLIDIVKF
jgi:hypothetical protein